VGTLDLTPANAGVAAAVLRALSAGADVRGVLRVAHAATALAAWYGTPAEWAELAERVLAAAGDG